MGVNRTISTKGCILSIKQSIASTKVLRFDKFCFCAGTQGGFPKKSEENVWWFGKNPLPLHPLS